MSNDKQEEYDDNLAFQMWKVHTEIGGQDKNWMIQIVTWLHGISIAILAFTVGGDSADIPLRANLPYFGAGLSLVAAMVAALYGGYAAKHWKIADTIAGRFVGKWGNEEVNRVGTPPIWLLGWSARLLAWPCKGKVAPVFTIFFWGSLIFASIQILLVCSGAT